MPVRRFKVEKLIRDRLPEIMHGQGLTTFERQLGDDEYRVALRTKLVEEAREAEAAEDRADLLTELGDVLEVIHALAAAHGLKIEDVETERLRKRAVRGGFEGRVYNAAVEAYDHCAALAYYTDRPDQYPEEVIDGVVASAPPPIDDRAPEVIEAPTSENVTGLCEDAGQDAEAYGPELEPLVSEMS